ncbi:1869_t:CDS:1, partial [Gigaspora rosea]
NKFTKICVLSTQLDSTITTTQISLTDENTGIGQEANKPPLETPTRPILVKTQKQTILKWPLIRT